MLYIEKKAPPQLYRKTVAEIKGSPTWRSIHDGDTKAIRDQFDRLPKSEIRDALLAEQHYICAYCMKRIRNNDDSSKQAHMNIEHWFPLSRDKERALDYKNFLGVCKGGADVDGPRNRILCCDASNEDEANLTVNPLDKGMMQYIACKKDGTIYCLKTAGSDVVKLINHDVNEVLRLNGKAGQDTATGLKKGRRDAYRQVEKQFAELANCGKLTSAKISKMIVSVKSRYPRERPMPEGTVAWVKELFNITGVRSIPRQEKL